jgi:hypothetical protein
VYVCVCACVRACACVRVCVCKCAGVRVVAHRICIAIQEKGMDVCVCVRVWCGGTGRDLCVAFVRS